MPSNLRLSRQDLARILGDNPKFIRAFEEMFAQTTDIVPDQVNLLLTLVSIAATSAEDAAGSADNALRAAQDALSTFATLPEPVAADNAIAALQAQLSAIPEPPRDYGVFYAAASEALAEGAMVNVYNSAGVPTVRNADADPSNFEAIGFTEAACASGQTATIRISGVNDRLSGLTIGARYYLSDTTPGAITATAPVTVGNLLQPVGIAVSSTALAFTYIPATVI